MWTIEEVATRDVVTASLTDTAADCAKVMLDEGFRHLPVVDAERRPVGMVTDYRVYGLTRRDLGHVQVSVFVEPVEAAVGVGVSVPAALDGLLHGAQKAVLLLDDVGRLAGIFTEHDGMRLAEVALDPSLRVSDVLRAGREVHAIPLGTTAEEARSIMIEQGIRHLPVLTPGGRVTSVVSVRDLAGLELSVIDDRLPLVVHHVGLDDDLHKAVSLMVRHQVGSLPVVDDDMRPLGILTRTDVLRALRDRIAG